MTRILTRGAYVLLGAILLLAGTAVVLYKTDLLPPAIAAAIMSEAGGNLNTLHIVQELGTVFVFTGLISFYFAWHYDQSWYCHGAMTTFLALLALVHWIDVRGPNTSFTEPIPVTIPFLVFVALAVFRLLFPSRAALQRTS